MEWSSPWTRRKSRDPEILFRINTCARSYHGSCWRLSKCFSHWWKCGKIMWVLGWLAEESLEDYCLYQLSPWWREDWAKDFTMLSEIGCWPFDLLVFFMAWNLSEAQKHVFPYWFGALGDLSFRFCGFKAAEADRIVSFDDICWCVCVCVTSTRSWLVMAARAFGGRKDSCLHHSAFICKMGLLASEGFCED